METYTPEEITELKPNQVFVFGSNLAGIHGGGAAWLAKAKFGAKPGVGCGLMGQSYGIATKDHQLQTLSLPRIQDQVDHFLHFAEEHPNLEFLVTKIGCGLAGYTVADIAPMFQQSIPKNVILPKEFHHA
jgi:hypothetical protein